MHTVVEMPEFEKCVKSLKISEAERKEIIDAIATNPQAGDEIQGTGGARKIRLPVPSKGKGKSGGYRVITFYSGDDIPVFVLSAYEKGKKDTLTQKEKNILKLVLGLVAEEYRGRKTR